MSSINRPGAVRSGQEGCSPRADGDCCGMVYIPRKGRSNEVKLGRTQRNRHMRRNFLARRLGHLALQAPLSHSAAPIWPLPVPAAIGAPAPTITLESTVKGGTQS